MIGSLIFGLLIAVNLLISAYNAWAVGSMWAECKEAGGWSKLSAYAGWTMSACGFTWVYALVIGIIASSFGFITEAQLQQVVSLVYLLIIFFVIGSGLVAMINSWVAVYRERSVSNMGAAGWNTFAQVYNTYSAIEAIPQAWSSVKDIFVGGGGDDGDDDTIVIVIVLVAASLGIISTLAISNMATKSHANKMLIKMYSQFKPGTHD